MLPNELLLDMLRCADYKTLVLAKLAGPRLLRLITEFAAELAHRRTFRIAFNIRCIHHIEATTHDQRRETISYEPGNKRSLAAACRKLTRAIGPHLVEQLTFYDDWWNMPHVGVVFEAAPPLKYAECVELFSRFDSTTSGNSEVLMRHFVGMKELRLYIDDEVLRQFDWTFLGREPARELRLIKFTRGPFWSGNANGSVEDLLRYCTTLPRLRGGGTLEIDLSESLFPAAFGQRIIKLLKGSGSEVTFRMLTHDVLVLDEGEYTLDVDGTTRHYASVESGIVVEVRGRRVTIQSAALGPSQEAEVRAEKSCQ